MNLTSLYVFKIAVTSEKKKKPADSCKLAGTLSLNLKTCIIHLFALNTKDLQIHHSVFNLETINTIVRLSTWTQPYKVASMLFGLVCL
jgi:hypothetical protein